MSSLSTSERAEDQEWNDRAREAVVEVASRNSAFTTDHVWKELNRRGISKPREPRALGAIIRKAVGERLIFRSTYFSTSDRPACHSRPLRVWTSRIFNLPNPS